MNYYTQCHNFWKNGCPRVQGSKIRCKDCARQSYKRLEKQQIISHLRGDAEDATDVIGIYPLLPDDTCRFLVFDFDNHETGAEKCDFANADSEWKEEVGVLREICRLNGIDALVERSRSGRGAYLWIFFQKPIDAALARKFGNALLKKGAETVNLKSFRYYDRMLPMQDLLPPDGLGNLIALPLQGQALREGNSAFVDENWNAYPGQWEILLSKTKLTREFVEDRIKEWGMRFLAEMPELDKAADGEREKPWEKTRRFMKEDVEGKLQITMADALYLDASNLKPRIQNRIREMAAFKNPVFQKNQAMGLSNFNNSRYIYLGSDEEGYIKIPRGLLEQITEACEQAGIEYEIKDERSAGREIRATFNGQLKEAQIPAVKALEQYDTGILNAATAFGKTVVCCNLIARKRVNTLILLQSSALMEQWEEALNRFLLIEEEAPEYETPSGRKKRRKSVIVRLQGAHDSTTGIIDIAMAGSLCKKGQWHELLKEYGLVILDECHHAASETIADVLWEIRAKYVYGVTATPFRGDGLEKINFLLLGPIRYQYTSKDRAKEQGIAHLVYPRFTRAVAPGALREKMHANDAYEIVRHNEDRDELIIRDVKRCIEEGRTPVILSKCVDHSQRLYERLEDYADRIFLLSGSNSKRRHRELLEQMKQVKPEESMLLVATGKLIGEGFDFPRLDTLIMATPVAGKSVVEQYAGRLNRDYEGKKNVIIYDYVDSHISMFDKMYYKRLRAYKQIGYEIYSEQETEKQEAGLRIIIITWEPDRYGYGDSEYWMELQERMRSFGFELRLAEDYCEHYCVVDREIVWYGSVNFLGKEDAEDNLMRVSSRAIAAELLDLTFGSRSQENLL